MILTLIALGLTLIGVIIAWVTRDSSDDWWFAGTCIWVIFGLCSLFAVSQSTWGKKLEADIYIIKFDTIKETFETARTSTDISALELATIQRDVVERNVWLAKSKYWAKHPLTKWFWDKRVFEIEPIK